MKATQQLLLRKFFQLVLVLWLLPHEGYQAPFSQHLRQPVESVCLWWWSLPMVLLPMVVVVADARVAFVEEDEQRRCQ